MIQSRRNFLRTTGLVAAAGALTACTITTSGKTTTLTLNTAKGVQNPTEGQAYLAHFAGARGATNLIRADQNTPASSILSPAQVAANPFLRGMTAGQVQDWAAQKMGGAAPQTQQMTAPQPSAGYGAPAPVQSGPSMSALIGVMSDPRANQQTRGVASALLNNQLQLQQVQQRYAMEQADPENQARRRPQIAARALRLSPSRISARPWRPDMDVTTLLTSLFSYVLPMLPAQWAAAASVIGSFVVSTCALAAYFWPRPKDGSKWLPLYQASP